MSNQSTSATIGHDQKGACASGAGMTRGSPRLLRHPDPCPAAYEALARTRPDLTSSPPWIRGHWQIENGLHWVRDVTFAEDLSRSAPATTRRLWPRYANLAISLYRLAGATNIAAALRNHVRDALRPLPFLKII